MRQILNLILFFYLAAACAGDIKKKTVSVKMAVCFGTAAIFLRVIAAGFQNGDAQALPAAIPAAIPAVIPAELAAELAAGILPGLLLLGIAYITRQAVGYGDGIVLMVCGLFAGARAGLVILINGLLFSAVAAVYFLAVKRAGGKKEIPFVPCLLCGYMIWMCFGG